MLQSRLRRHGPNKGTALLVGCKVRDLSRGSRRCEGVDLLDRRTPAKSFHSYPCVGMS